MKSRPRIVSLLPGATEILFRLELGPWVVGRSHACDSPVGVDNLPACTVPLADFDGASAEVDDRIRDLVRRGLSPFRVDAAALAELQPTHVVTQMQCEVCAATERQVLQAVDEVLGYEPDVISLRPERLADVWYDMVRIGDAFDVGAKAEALVTELRGRVHEIRDRARGLDQVSVACIEWIDPLMGAGHWTPDLVANAGGREVIGEAGGRSRQVSWEELDQADPEAILVAPCGFSLERVLAARSVLETQPSWSHLRAVRSGLVAASDGEGHFTRPGPRLVESVEILAEVLHPDAFDFGHRGNTWASLSDPVP